MTRFVTILTLAALSGCIPPSKPAKSADRPRVLSGQQDEVALEVNGEELTLDQVEKRREALQTALPANTLERQLAVIADFEMLADEAEKRGYGKDPRVVSAVKDALAEEARRAKLDTEEPDVEVDEDALKAAFDKGRKQK